jgi:hypothetical protein
MLKGISYIAQLFTLPIGFHSITIRFFFVICVLVLVDDWCSRLFLVSFFISNLENLSII